MKKRFEELLRHAIEAAVKGGALKLESLPPLFLEIPNDPQFGDLASTVALQLARQVRRPPRAIAEAILAHFRDPDGLTTAVEIAGAGYLNFRFSPRFWRQCLTDMEEPDYGKPALGQGRRVLIEFVSANPTGPLHVGHGRGAVIGDVVARLLAAAGYRVVREYYVNDAGKQIETLGHSVLARLLQTYDPDAPFPEDGYPGDYLRELVTSEREALLSAIFARAGDDVPLASDVPGRLRQLADVAVAAAGELAGEHLLRGIKNDLRVLRVGLDGFVSERALRAEAAVADAIRALEGKGLVYEADGARWFRSTAFGDEKDRVIERSDGELTYFASDIAYHQHKLRRGFDQLINVWGADHHGYVKRVQAAIAALGRDPSCFHVLLVQLVRLTRSGEPLRMGKRTGEFVTLREVVDEVGPDATRFFFLMRKGDSHLDFDLDLAKKQSAENPVFYVQYAHARICSLFRQARGDGVSVPRPAEAALDRLRTPEEQEVIKLLARYPDIVEDAANELEPHRLVFYLIDLAGSFHRFYNRHRVLGLDAELTGARLYLVHAAQRVLRGALDLLGVNAPESM